MTETRREAAYRRMGRRLAIATTDHDSMRGVVGCPLLTVLSRLGLVCGLFAVTCALLVMPTISFGYAPIDDLVTTVAQLYDSGAISDVTVMSKLTVGLQTIGSLIDEGNKLAATPLLAAFQEDVRSLTGVALTQAAADRLIQEATTVATGL